jgi:YD repeat-containing protein
MTLITDPVRRLLDSSGALANGLITWTQTVPFTSGSGFTTRKPVTSLVTDGQLFDLDQNPFDMQASPDNTFVAVKEQFAGSSREWVTQIPDQESVFYGDLIIITDDQTGPNPTYQDVIDAATSAQISANAAAESAAAAEAAAGANVPVTYTWDATTGSVATITEHYVSGDRVTTFGGYTDDGDPTTEVDPDGSHWVLAYDASGNLITRTAA